MIMRTQRRILASIAAFSILFATPSRGEDIDIFATVPVGSDLPNVILVWDNSANWSASIPVDNCSYADGSGGPKATNPGKEQGSKMAIEKCALYNVIHALPVEPNGAAMFNVALVLFNESPAQNSGGYPRTQFLPMTAANKALLKSTIAGVTIGGDKGNNAAFSKTMYEAFLMFSKGTPYKGTAGTKYDRAAVLGGKYAGPAGTGCGKNHIIFVANGSPGEVTDNEAKALLAAAGGNTTPIVYPTAYVSNSDQGNWADEFARFLRTVDTSTKDGIQSITTHTIAVTGASSDGLYPNFMRAMANQGGGQYYAASDLATLTKYLTNIFNSIQAVNSVFASASLPITVTTKGTYKNQVFIGEFRPDGSARPRWHGNLKQYKFSYDPVTNTLQLADALGMPALNSATGFFTPSAVSTWTRDSTFWSNDPQGTPPSISDSPDGPIVEKGGAAQVLRTLHATDQARRKVYTCINCVGGTMLAGSASALFAESNTAVTAAMLGASSATERTSMINWIRGTDNQGDELGPGGTSTVRPSIHGDVLHSRPAVVDYGGSGGTIVFYGGNDGMLHAMDGNLSGATAGQELWSFVPQETLGRFKRMRDNAPEILFPTTPAGSLATPRDYMVDGPITIYQKLGAAGAIERVMLYASMRRGGRVIYAFDVTNPAAPVFVWKKTADTGTLGQTWSEPRVAKLKGSVNPVLVLGAGYDAAAEDVIPPGATTMGNAVLVIDAFTGTTLATLATARSVPAAVELLDTDYDGYVDRAYAVDMGSNVYRIDFENSAGDGAAARWTISTFAALGLAGDPRKFFYDADVVQTGKFIAVMVGSGNRERPLQMTSNDRWYTLFDYAMGKGAPGKLPITDANLVPYKDFELTGQPAGCYLALDPAGEKVVTATVTTGGYSYFATNMPIAQTANACVSNLGIATTYQVPLFCGAPVKQQLAGGGLPPTPVTGYVDVSYPDPVNPSRTVSKTVPFIIGGINPALSGIGATRVAIDVDPARRRTFWYTNTNR
jgi:type IV pilus assembly protein PilY1